jgi:hypothetical protein
VQVSARPDGRDAALLVEEPLQQTALRERAEEGAIDAAGLAPLGDLEDGLPHRARLVEQRALVLAQMPVVLIHPRSPGTTAIATSSSLALSSKSRVTPRSAIAG